MTGHDDLLREHLRAAQRRRTHIDAEIARLRQDRSAEWADDEHDPEGVTLSAEWSRLEGLRAAALADLAEIDAALGRIERGEYGVCVGCGRGIPPGRLEIRPTAMRCVECAAAASR